MFSETAYEIFMIKEVGNTKFIAYGRDANDRGVILGLDLSAIFDRMCEKDNDYEGWEFPKEGCVLG